MSKAAGKIVKNSFIYIISGLLPQVGSIILLPFYTQYLSTQQYGELVLYIALTLLLQVVFSLGLESSILYNYYEYKENSQKLKTVLSSIFCLFLIYSVVLIGIFSFSGQFLFRSVLQNLSFYPFGFMSIITAFFNSSFKTYLTLLNAEQKPKRYLFSNIFNFVLTIGISVGGLFIFPNSLIGPMWGRLLSGLGIFLLSSGYIFRQHGLHLKKDAIKSTLRFNINIWLITILFTATGSIDRFVIDKYMSLKDVAVYDIIVRCALLLDVMMSAVNNSIIPPIIEKWKKYSIAGTQAVTMQFFGSYMILFMVAYGFVVMVMPVLAPILVHKKEFMEGFPFLAIVAVWPVLRINTFLYVNMFYSEKKSADVIWIYILSLSCKLLLLTVFIQSMGLMGLFVSLSVSALVESIIYQLFIKYKLGIEAYGFVDLVLKPVGFILLVFTIHFAMEHQSLHLKNAVVLLASIVYPGLVYINHLKDLKILIEGFAGKFLKKKAV